jgi:hypothetical protein
MRRSRYAKIAAAFAAFSVCASMSGAPAAQPPTIDDALRQIEAYAPQAL